MDSWKLGYPFPGLPLRFPVGRDGDAAQRTKNGDKPLFAGMVNAWVAHKLLKSNILRVCTMS
jgi:hypothetical protein